MAWTSFPLVLDTDVIVDTDSDLDETQALWTRPSAQHGQVREQKLPLVTSR